MARNRFGEVFGWLVAAAAVGALIWFDPVGRRRATAVDADTVARIATSLDATTQPLAPEPLAPEPLAPDAPPVAIDAEIPDAPDTPLYNVTEALDDVAAGPLVFVGTGEWFGNFSIHACAYRNARVIVVNVYCTVKEQPALGLVVLSPARGRLMIYAEAESAISPLRRAAYLQFRAETEPAVPAEPLGLDFTYAQLHAWDERRYNARVGACWTGDREGCSTGLGSRLEAWAPAAKTFLASPPDTFYRLAKDLHARAVRDSQRSTKN